MKDSKVPGRPIRRKSVVQIQRRIQLIERVYLAFSEKKILVQELAKMINIGLKCR